MSTGAVMFAGGTFVAVSDILIAIYFRSVADRVESGELVRKEFDPGNARRFATMMLVSAPLIWIVFVLIAFGVIPAGIDTIKF